MPPIRFGAFLTLHPPEEQFAIARRVDELGFDSLWTGDHVSFHGADLRVADAARLVRRHHEARQARRGCLPARSAPADGGGQDHARPSTRSPAADSSSGWEWAARIPKEFEACGIPHNERGARVTEGIDVVRTLWRDSPASFKGRFTEFEGVSIDPKPVQKPAPPIWVGGRSDAALARAGRQGDGWISYVVQPERYKQSLAKIEAAAEAAGRSPRRLREGAPDLHHGGPGLRERRARVGGTAVEALRAGLRPARAKVRDHRHARPVRRAARALRRGGLPLLRARTPSAMPRTRRGRSRPSPREIIPRAPRRSWRRSRGSAGPKVARCAWPRPEIIEVDLRMVDPPSSSSRRGSGSRCPSDPRSCARGAYGRRPPAGGPSRSPWTWPPAASARSGLRALKPGDPVEFKGPTGGFVFNRADPRRAVFVAEEIGIVPVRSILCRPLRDGLWPAHQPDLLGARSRGSSTTPSSARSPAATRGSPTCRRCASRPATWRGETGEAAAAVDRLVHSVDKLVVYVCGGGETVNAVRDALVKKGMDRKSVKWEKFW